MAIYITFNHTKISMDDYYVYAHVDKDNQIPFYIGKGRERRAYSKERHDNWVYYVSKYAPDYEVKFIANKVSEFDAFEIENFFIGKLGKIHNGLGPLLNWTDGGYGEGVYIKIGFDDGKINFERCLTEYGNNLLNTDKKLMTSNKCNLFIAEITEKSIIENRQRLLKEISNVCQPRKPWIVPFCLIDVKNKKDTLSIVITKKEELIELINKPINLSELPDRPYVDSLIHRIMIYFDILLQENVKLVSKDKIISRSESDWYFYADYLHGYIKIIQCITQGKQLAIKFIKKNKVNHQRNDIYDFEVIVVSSSK